MDTGAAACSLDGKIQPTLTVSKALIDRQSCFLSPVRRPSTQNATHGQDPRIAPQVTSWQALGVASCRSLCKGIYGPPAGSSRHFLVIVSDSSRSLLRRANSYTSATWDTPTNRASQNSDTPAQDGSDPVPEGNFRKLWEMCDHPALLLLASSQGKT